MVEVSHRGAQVGRGQSMVCIEGRASSDWSHAHSLVFNHTQPGCKLPCPDTTPPNNEGSPDPTETLLGRSRKLLGHSGMSHSISSYVAAQHATHSNSRLPPFRDKPSSPTIVWCCTSDCMLIAALSDQREHELSSPQQRETSVPQGPAAPVHLLSNKTSVRHP